MVYELYRLDQPDEVVYEVKALSSVSALAAASYNTFRANELFMYSHKTLTALCKKGVLGVRCKGHEPTGLPPVKGTMDAHNGVTPGKRGMKKGVA